MILFYIRHGEPIYDPDSLTPLGRRQAEAVARRLALFGVDRVFTSSSNRAIETSRPLCDILRIKPEPALDWINESYAWNELSVEDKAGHRHWCYDDERQLAAFSDPSVRALGERWYEHRAFDGFPSFGEAVRRMRENAFPLLSSLGYAREESRAGFKVVRDNPERIALFAHEGAGLLFLSTILDIPYPLFAPAFSMEHTGMTAVEFTDRGGWCVPRVLQLSCDAHLYRDALPLNYQNRLRF